MIKTEYENYRSSSAKSGGCKEVEEIHSLLWKMIKECAGPEWYRQDHFRYGFIPLCFLTLAVDSSGFQLITTAASPYYVSGHCYECRDYPVSQNLPHREVVGKFYLGITFPYLPQVSVKKPAVGYMYVCLEDLFPVEIIQKYSKELVSTIKSSIVSPMIERKEGRQLRYEIPIHYSFGDSPIRVPQGGIASVRHFYSFPFSHIGAVTEAERRGIIYPYYLLLRNHSEEYIRENYPVLSKRYEGLRERHQQLRQLDTLSNRVSAIRIEKDILRWMKKD